MVSYKLLEITSIPLEKAFRKLRLVDPDIAVVRAAESIGVSFGR
jgi:hypothetical protein